MKYGIITTGSRGDVQPFIALTLGLQKQGYSVVLMAPENFKDWIESLGIPFIPLAGNVEEIIQSPQALHLLKGGNVLRFFYHLQKIAVKTSVQANLIMLENAEGIDFFISSILPFPIVYSIAEKFKKPCSGIFLSMPGTPTQEFPHPVFGSFNHRWFNRFSYQVMELGWWMIKKRVNIFRTQIGLPETKHWKKYISDNPLILYPMSRQLLSQPNDWPSNTHVTGFLQMTPANREHHTMDKTPKGLTEWLEKGSKPYYLGFGSIPIPDTLLFCNVLSDLLKNHDCRIVFCTGWSLLPDMPEHPNLFVCQYINHDWLLPKCKAAIFHGGIGTIGAVLKSKIPMIILSVLADQPHNGDLIAGKRLGVHIPFRKLSAEKLWNAMEVTQTQQILESVLAIGHSIVLDDGVTEVICQLEKYNASCKTILNFASIFNVFFIGILTHCQYQIIQVGYKYAYFY